MKRKKLVLSPITVSAEDYHMFYDIKYYYSLVFKNIRFKELGINEDTGQYVATFWSTGYLNETD